MVAYFSSMVLAGGFMGGLASDRKQIRGRKPLGCVRYLLHRESCVASFCLTSRTNCVRIVFDCCCKVVTRVREQVLHIMESKALCAALSVSDTLNYFLPINWIVVAHRTHDSNAERSVLGAE